MSDLVEAVPVAVAVVCTALSWLWFARLSGTRDPLARYDEPYTPEPGDDEETQPLAVPSATTVRQRHPLRERARQA